VTGFNLHASIAMACRTWVKVDGSMCLHGMQACRVRYNATPTALIYLKLVNQHIHDIYAQLICDT